MSISETPRPETGVSDKGDVQKSVLFGSFRNWVGILWVRIASKTCLECRGVVWTLDIGMEQIVHTPHDGDINTHTTLTLTGKVTESQIHQKCGLPCFKNFERTLHYYYRFRLSADPTRVWEHVRCNLVYSQGDVIDTLAILIIWCK